MVKGRTSGEPAGGKALWRFPAAQSPKTDLARDPDAGGKGQGDQGARFALARSLGTGSPQQYSGGSTTSSTEQPKARARRMTEAASAFEMSARRCSYSWTMRKKAAAAPNEGDRRLSCSES